MESLLNQSANDRAHHTREKDGSTGKPAHDGFCLDVPILELGSVHALEVESAFAPGLVTPLATVI